MKAPDFGDMVTGTVADENDWTGSGPRVIRPRRVVRGRVVVLFGTTDNAAKIETPAGEVLCVRLAGRAS